MGQYSSSLQKALIPSILLFAIGWLLGSANLIKTNHVPGLNKYTLKFGVPMLIFLNFSQTKLGRGELLFILIMFIHKFACAALWAIPFLFSKSWDLASYVFFFMSSVYSNNAVFGAPFLKVMYSGQNMDAFAYLSSAPNTLFAFLWSLFFLELRKLRNEMMEKTGKTLRLGVQGYMKLIGKVFIRVLTNHVFWGIVLGIICNVSKFEFPVWLSEFVDLAAKSTFPVSMVNMGLFFSHFPTLHVDMKKLASRIAYLLTGGRCGQMHFSDRKQMQGTEGESPSSASFIAPSTSAPVSPSACVPPSNSPSTSVPPSVSPTTSVSSAPFLILSSLQTSASSSASTSASASAPASLASSASSCVSALAEEGRLAGTGYPDYFSHRKDGVRGKGEGEGKGMGEDEKEGEGEVEMEVIVDEGDEDHEGEERGEGREGVAGGEEERERAGFFCGNVCSDSEAEGGRRVQQGTGKRRRRYRSGDGDGGHGEKEGKGGPRQGEGQADPSVQTPSPSDASSENVSHQKINPLFCVWLSVSRHVLSPVLMLGIAMMFYKVLGLTPREVIGSVLINCMPMALVSFGLSQEFEVYSGNMVVSISIQHFVTYFPILILWAFLCSFVVKMPVDLL